jgi:4-hydroxybenzoate polyprenyltransferase
VLKAFIRLVRWPNLLIIALIFILAKTQIIDPIAELSGAVSCLTPLNWWLVASATVLIAASGNVVNDIFDQDIDVHNRPDRVVVGSALTEQQAWNLYYVLITLGVGAGMYLCLQLGNISNSLVFLLTAGGLYFYSYSYKRQFVIGNLVVAFMAGLVPFMPLYVEMMCNETEWNQLPWAPILVAYGFFAFLTTLLREVIKDMEDIKGDQLLRCRTVPIVIGLNGAKLVVLLLVLVLVAAVAWLQKAWLQQHDLTSVIYFLVTVQLPAAVVAARVVLGSEPKDFRLASTLTKVLMLGGILSMIVYRFTLQ